MEQTHSIFIATSELYTSPLIQRYAGVFDVSLTLGNASLVSFVIPSRTSEEQLRKTFIHFNADLLDVLYASIYPSADGKSATLTLTIEPRDIGVTSITISSVEEAADIPSFTSYVPHFIRNKPIS